MCPQPNKIKFPAVNDGKSIQVNGFSVGVNAAGAYGPTTETGYWNGIKPPFGGYVLYVKKLTQGPSIHLLRNDGELIRSVNLLAGENVVSNADDALRWYISARDAFVVNMDYPDVVTSGLTVMYDSSYVPSYPKMANVWDDLGFNGLSANLNNGAVFVNDRGGYLDFSSDISQYATASDTGSLGNFTVEAWVYLKGLPQANTYPAIITNTYNGGLVLNYAMGFLNSPWDGKIAVGFFNQGWNTTEGFAPNINEWYHIAGTYDGNEIRQYVDGVLVSSAATTATAVSSGLGVRLMRRWDDAEFISGFLANAKIYNRAVSETEVLQNYYAHGLPVDYISDSLNTYLDVTNFRSFGNKGDLIKDMSSNGNDAQRMGNATLSYHYSVWSLNLNDNGYIKLAPNFFNPDNNTPFTISMWFHITNAGNGGILLSQQDTDTLGTAGNFVPAIYIDTNGNIRVSCFWNNGISQLVTVGTYDDEQYHNVVVTYENNTMKLYMDNILQGSLPFTQHNYSTDYYYFIGDGQYTSWPNLFQGHLDYGRIVNFAFYEKALTAGEVSRNYNAMGYIINF